MDDAAALTAGKPRRRRRRVVLMAAPGMGHLIPMTELAKRLSLPDCGFAVTLLTFSDLSSPSQPAFLARLPSDAVTTVALPHVGALDGLSPDVSIEERLMAVITGSLVHLGALFTEMKADGDVAAFVADLFGYTALPVAAEMSIPHFIFFPSNLQLLTFLLRFPEIDRNTSGEFRDLPEPIKLPGCVALPGADLCDPVQDRGSGAYAVVLGMSAGYAHADGFLVNSFVGLEPETAKALAAAEPAAPRAYAVGPLVRVGHDERDEFGCLAWLDRQPAKSVLFVSFGSGGTLSTAQTAELALGLEKSGQRFLWVVHRPSDGDASADFFAAGAEEEGVYRGPAGFAERTRGVGLTVPGWAPQAAVLAHPAVGGFMSHCGWNSTLESLANGVPMAAWPLYAEQRMNAVLLSDGAEVALRMKARDADGVFDREEIARVAKELLGGESHGFAVRIRAAELREAAAQALSPGGSSHTALLTAVSSWKTG